MKQTYRGFELSAKREPSLGGDELLYYYILRINDGWFLDDGFTTGDETPAEYMVHLRARVDDYMTNPLDYYTESLDYAVGEMLFSFTPAEIGEHVKRLAEKFAQQMKEQEAG